MPNIGLSIANGFVNDMTSMGGNWLQKILANGFGKNQGAVRFYANYGAAPVGEG